MVFTRFSGRTDSHTHSLTHSSQNWYCRTKKVTGMQASLVLRLQEAVLKFTIGLKAKAGARAASVAPKKLKCF